MDSKRTAQIWLFLAVILGILFNFIMPPLFLKTSYGFSNDYIFTSFIVYIIMLILFVPAPLGIFSACGAVEKSPTLENREKCFVDLNSRLVYIDIYIILLFSAAGYIVGLDLYKRGLWPRGDFISFVIWSFVTGLGVSLFASNGFRYLLIRFFRELGLYEKPRYIRRSIKAMILYITIVSVLNSIVYMTLASYNQLHKRVESEKRAVINKMQEIRKMPVEDAITELGFLEDEMEQLFKTSWKMRYMQTLPIILLIVVAMNPIVFALELRKSLDDILEGANQASSGDLRALIPVTRIDEIGNLISTFNNMIRSLNSMVENILSLSSTIDTLSDRIRKTIADNSTSIAEISTSLQQISASTEEFKRSVEDIHRQIGDLNNKMNTAAATVESNRSLLESLFKDIHLLTLGIQEISDKVQNLTAKISKIGEVGNVIYKIADDTHLLSINASIEASVAGEHGKRFSIIAAEIRKLAENAKEFASQIERTIKEITEAASEAITTTEKSVVDANKSLEKIDEAKGALDLIFDNVMEGRVSVSVIEKSTGQQETSIRQLAEALGEVKRAIDLIRQSSSDLEGSFNDFREKIEKLNHEVKKFKIQGEA